MPCKEKTKTRRLNKSSVSILPGFFFLAIVLFAPAAYAAQVCSVASNVASIPAPTNANQLIYSPTYNSLALRNGGSAIALINLGTGQSTTHFSNRSFVDMAISPSGRYVFGADYGGENIGYGTPATPSYVHRLDLSSNTWETKTAYIAGGIQAVSDDQFILKSKDQWVTFTNNSWGTGDAVVPLNTPSGYWGPGYYASVYYGDFRYDMNTGRLLHGNSGSSSQEIQAFKIVANEFVRQEGSGIYGSAQGYGGTVTLATDGSAFYYGRLQVDALDVTRNLRVFPELIYAATGNVAFGNGKYFDAHTGDLAGSLGFNTTFYALNSHGDDFWAFDSSQNMLRHFTFASTTCPTPAAPIGVSAAVTPGTNNIVMSWTGVSGATGYNIYMANQSGVTKSNYLSLAGGHVHANVMSPYTEAGAATGTYYLVVTAFNDSGESVESAQVSITVPDTQMPSTPTGLTATAVSDSQINLSWNASTDNIAVTSYRVLREGIFLAYVYAPNVSFSDTGLMPSTLYSYTVAACDAAGNCSAYSGPASATTLIASDATPNPFSFFAQSNVARNTAVTSNAITVSGINLPAAISVVGGEYNINGGVFTTAPGTVLNGQSVTVRVTSSASYATTTTATLTIGGVSASFSVTTVALTFSAAPYLPLTVSNSWIMRRNGVGAYTNTITGTQVVNGVTTAVMSFSFDGSENDLTNDELGVRLHQAYFPPTFIEGCGTVAETDTYSPPLVIAPASGTVGQSVSSSGVVTADVGVCGVYSLSYFSTSTAQAQEVVTVPAGGFEAVKLQVSVTAVGITVSNTVWLARDIGIVKQVDTDGTIWELLSTNIVRTDPDAVEFASQTGVPASSVVASNTVTITGITAAAPVSITGGEYSINGGVYTSQTGAVVNGDTVQVRLTSAGSGGVTTSAALTVGGVSATFSVTTLSVPDTQVPSVPTALTATAATSSQINLSWSASTDNVGVTQYKIYRGGTLRTTLNGTPPVTSYSDTGLTASTAYSYTVQACDAAGNCSTQSASASATTQAPPDTQPPTAPSGLTATALSASQINLSWTAATDNVGVTQYKLYRNGVLLTTLTGTPPPTTYSDTGVASLTTYSYSVQACDAAGNCSAQSASISATASGWSTLPSLPEARVGAAGLGYVGALGLFWVFGGHDGTSDRNTMYALVPALGDLWFTAFATLPEGRYGGNGIATLNGKFYLAGGWSTSSGLPHDNLWEFDTVSGSWTSKANMPLPSACGATGAILGKLYVTTACDGNSGYRNTLHAWDPASNSWTQLPSSASAHANAAFGVINGKLYIAGGVDNTNSRTNMLEAYDPASNTWSTLAPMPTARDGAAGAVIGGNLVVAGGYTGTSYTNTVEIYDPQSDTWTTGPPMPAAQAQMAAGVINNVGYFVGGTSGGAALATAYALTLPGVDIQPPTQPSGFVLNSATLNQISFSWTPSSDNIGVAGYNVLRDGVEVFHMLASPSVMDSGLSPSTSYSYTVVACDVNGNCADGATVIYTTLSGSDTQAPTMPSGVTATAVGSYQVNVSWSASTDSVGVTQYKLYRNAALLTTLSGAPPATSYSDFSVTGSTTYTYTVQACNAAGHCSAQSVSASTTTAPGTGGGAAAPTVTVTTVPLTLGFTPLLESGFNLIGNSLSITLDVVAIFGNQDVPTAITSSILTIWKWNAVDGRWAFYSPQLTAAGNASYAASKGYEVLSTIAPGEGYWVNAISVMSLPAQTGSAFNWNGFNFVNLTTGFNLIAHAENVTPSQFNTNVSATPPSPGVIPTTNFVSLWAWDAVAGNWYFYSPLLESSGGLPAVKSYADTHFFRHFQDFGKTIGIGIGFWVNRP